MYFNFRKWAFLGVKRSATPQYNYVTAAIDLGKDYTQPYCVALTTGSDFYFWVGVESLI
jgi:hypothetical protein